MARTKPTRCTLVLRNCQKPRAVDVRLFRRIVATLLGELLEIKSGELGIHIVGAADMTRLNETFLKHGGSTDVITFDYSVAADVRRLKLSPKKSEPPHVGCYGGLHGEIFVCVDEAAMQARRFRTSWQSELVRYAVHGVLHLRGFDDKRAVARRRMKREENRLLRVLARRFALSRLRQKARLRP